MGWRRLLIGFLLSLAVCAILYIRPEKGSVTPVRAKNYVGYTETVCGTVTSSRYAESSLSQPTFLDLDEPFPRQVFTIVIWGRDRAKFGEPEKTYLDKSICVTGQITEYQSVPEITASEPAQIKVQQKK